LTFNVAGLSFCSGVVAGLVVITPGSGFVPPWAAIIMGAIGGVITNGKQKLTQKEDRPIFQLFRRSMSDETCSKI
jgi:ammonia channel protein AmtB